MGRDIRRHLACFWAACLCVCLFGQSVHADDDMGPTPDPPAATEAELRAVLAVEPVDPQRVLDALLASKGMFDSESETQGFSVELLGRQDDGTEILLLGDFWPGDFRSVEFRNRDIFAVRSDRHVMTQVDKKWSLTTDGAVRVDWNAIRSHQPVAASSEPHRINGSIHEMLEGTDPWKTAEWDRLSQGLRATNEKGDTLVVCFRTASDTEKYGSAISHVSLWHEGRLLRELRNPYRLPVKYRCFGAATPERFQKWIDQQSGNLELEKRENFWTWLQNVEQEQRDVDERVRHFFDKYLSNVIRFVGLQGTAVSPEMQALEFSFRNGGFAEIMSTMRTLSHAETAYPRNEMLISDQAVIWSRFEHNASPGVWSNFVISLLNYVASEKGITLNERVQLLSNLATSGRPGTLIDSLLDSEDHAIIEAVVFSQWQYPCNSAHREACLNAITSTSENTAFIRDAAIESFIHFDDTDSVPSSVIEDWWRRHVVEARCDESDFHVTSQIIPRDIKKESVHLSIAAHQKEIQAADLAITDARFDRNRCISLLCRYPSGRRFLISRMKTKDPRTVKSALQTSLKITAMFTRRQKRFDFMSADECDMINELPDPSKGSGLGVDREGGKAAPFPVLEE